uniref:MbcD n=1 Tax=Actinosynnema pretiosum subsp. pretiosum TaxID=103721 RepID=B5A9Q5_9PSEU|nr:MbcD [Actinosynnema pretiosum subsp. pretiosum]
MSDGPRAGSGGPVRVAVVGLGWVAREVWLPRLLGSPAFRVVAVVEPSAQARAAVPGSRGITALERVEDLRRDEVDLAVVAVPNHLHAPVASGLLRRGVPVFLEKPLCLGSAEAAALTAAEQAGGAVLLGGSAARHRADVRALRQVAASLGALRHVDVSWVRSKGIPDRGGWFTNRTRSGGGALVDLGWHLLDTARVLLRGATGDPEGAELEHVTGAVSADFVNDHAFRAAWRGDGAPVDPVVGDVEDTARGFLVTRSGISIGVRAAWASHQALDTTVVRVEGSGGTAELRCTFGFSPNREGPSRLLLTTDGRTTPVELPAEPVGAEYDAQLASLPTRLADPATRGEAASGARWIAGAIERVYRAADTVRCAERRHAPVDLVPTGAP